MMQPILRNTALLLAAFAINAAAQAPTQGPPADQLAKAAALFAASDWKGTLTAYSAIADAYPRNALARFRVGIALMELHRLPEAEANMRRGESLGVAPGNAGYRLAQVLAEQGKKDDAIRELERAVANQAPLTAQAIDTDPHFKSLKTHAKWKAVIDGFDATARPCMYDPRYREFDFWIGDWDVRTTGAPAVGPAARNTVTLDDDGCVVTEHWTGPGSTGQSFNMFDRSYGVWRQTWVDNSGGQHDYRGNLKDGNMVFRGDLPGAPGQTTRVPTRLTFFKIGKDSVRQFSEVSSDSGRTWQTSYDLMYVRRKGK